MLLSRPSSEPPTEECPAGYMFYSCAANSFAGCCSIDPCGRPRACPIANQPGFSMSPGPMASSISSSTIPGSTPQAPTIALATGTLPSIQSPPYSTSSSPSASNASSRPKISHVGLIAGLIVGLLVLLIAITVLLCKLWRHRRIKKVGHDDTEPSLLMKGNLRTTKAHHLPHKAASGPATTAGAASATTPDRNKPVPWVRGSSETPGMPPLTSVTAESTTASRQPSIRAVPFSPSRVGAAGEGTPKPASPSPSPSVMCRDRGGEAGSVASRAESLVDSLFDGSPGRRGSELGTMWVDSRLEYAELRSPLVFHGLSAPPRSRDGSRPGSKGTQDG